MIDISASEDFCVAFLRYFSDDGIRNDKACISSLPEVSVALSLHVAHDLLLGRAPVLKAKSIELAVILCY